MEFGRMMQNESVFIALCVNFEAKVVPVAACS